jgi:hypothetical protein
LARWVSRAKLAEESNRITISTNEAFLGIPSGRQALSFMTKWIRQRNVFICFIVMSFLADGIEYFSFLSGRFSSHVLFESFIFKEANENIRLRC